MLQRSPTILRKLLIDGLQEFLPLGIWESVVSSSRNQPFGGIPEMESIVLFQLFFQLRQLILVVQKKPIVKPCEFAIHQEVGIASFNGGKLAIALRVSIYCMCISWRIAIEFVPLHILRERMVCGTWGPNLFLISGTLDLPFGRLKTFAMRLWKGVFRGSASHN